MPRKGVQDVEIWEHVSDIDPLWGVPGDALYGRCVRRFADAGEPYDRLKTWLDAHNVYPKRADYPERVRALPKEGLISLLYTLEDWATELHPPFEDTV